MVGHGGSSAGSYLADPTSPIPSHCASIVVTSTLRVNYFCVYVTGGDHTRTKTNVMSKVGGLTGFMKKREKCIGCKTPLDKDGECAIVAKIWLELELKTYLIQSQSLGFKDQTSVIPGHNNTVNESFYLVEILTHHLWFWR